MDGRHRRSSGFRVTGRPLSSFALIILADPPKDSHPWTASWEKNGGKKAVATSEGPPTDPGKPRGTTKHDRNPPFSLPLSVFGCRRGSVRRSCRPSTSLGCAGSRGEKPRLCIEAMPRVPIHGPARPAPPARRGAPPAWSRFGESGRGRFRSWPTDPQDRGLPDRRRPGNARG